MLIGLVAGQWFKLNIDQGFRRILAIANAGHPSHVSMGITKHLYHWMNSPVDSRARISYRHGDRIHQKWHVIGHRPQRRQPTWPSGWFQMNQGFFRVALEGHHPVLLGDVKKLLGGTGGERRLAAHFKISRHETAEQGLMFDPDVGGNQCFKLGL